MTRQVTYILRMTQKSLRDSCEGLISSNNYVSYRKDRSIQITEKETPGLYLILSYSFRFGNETSKTSLSITYDGLSSRVHIVQFLNR